MIECKNVITDVEKLYDWATEIDPRKEGKLVQEIVLALKTTMRENNLEYLTAPQLGYDKRIFCIRFGGNDYRTFLNPVITRTSAFQFARETCNSLPEKTFIMPRFGNIEVIYTTPLGKIETRKIIGRSAVVFNHCLDHLNGLLISDIGLEIDEMFDNATDEEREEVLKMYAESLDLRQKQLKEEIAENKELNDLDKAIDFIASVDNGQTKLETLSE